MEVLTDLGDLFVIQKDFKRAAAIYGEVKQKSPGIPAGYVKLSALYMVQNNLDKAAAELKQALQVNPRSLPISTMLVQVYVKQKNMLPQLLCWKQEFNRIRWMHLRITS